MSIEASHIEFEMDGRGFAFKAMRKPQTSLASMFLICSEEEVGSRPNFDGETGCSDM
jgi:hypothetical protein